MSDRELVFESLKTFGTSSAKQLSCYIKRTHGVDISPASVSGRLRYFVDRGAVAKSNLTGTTVYWVNKEI